MYFYRMSIILYVLLLLVLSVQGLTYQEKAIHLGNLYANTVKDDQSFSVVGDNPLADFTFSFLQFSDTLSDLRNSAVSQSCMNHTEWVFSSLTDKRRRDWALRMIDSWAKLPSGVLDGNIQWLGAYDECINTTAVNFTGPNGTAPVDLFKGQYCRAVIGPPTARGTPGGIMNAFSSISLVLGLCLPTSCSQEDVLSLVNMVVELVPAKTRHNITASSVTCQKQHLQLDGRAIVVIGILCIFLLLIVLGTLYDVLIVSKHILMVCPSADEVQVNSDLYRQAADSEYTPLLKGKKKGFIDIENYQPGILGKLLLAFSLYTNGSKILSTHQAVGSLAALNGVRFISMTWVILGHTYFFALYYLENLLPFAQIIKRWSFQAILNATVSVDSFFTISGLLLAYLGLKEMKKSSGARKFNWGMFYLHRFWRLTPPYMLVMMVYVPLLKYWNNGPMYPQQGTEVDYCSDTWWQNLLYINNFFEKSCMGWSWYLANDMQFYVISPLMLVPLYYSGILGAAVCLVFLLATMTTSGVLSAVYDFPLAGGGNQAAGDNFFNIYYIKPYCRIGPYIIGILTGYLLYKTDCKFRMHKLLNLLGWAVAAGCCMSVLYGLYDAYNGHPDSTEVIALYNAVSRSVWALGVCWVIFACATGHGGIVNVFLSWKVFVPLSRLTYCAYLVHPVIMEVYYGSRRKLVYLTDLEAVYLYLGHLVLSYAVAFVTSLAFESPFMGLERVLLKRERRS